MGDVDEFAVMYQEWDGLFVAGHTLREGPYDLRDLAPTIIELLEMEPQGFQGTSLLGGSQRRSRSAPQPVGVGPR